MAKKANGKPKDWLIIYSDGSIFSSGDGAWEDAPGWDFQVGIQPNEVVGRQFLSRKDYYLLVDGEIIDLDFTGLLDYLVNVLGIVKVGRMLTNHHFQDIVDQAHEIEGFPRKSAYLPKEPRRRNGI